VAFNSQPAWYCLWSRKGVSSDRCTWRVTVLEWRWPILVNSRLLLLFNRIPYGCHLLPSHLCEDLEVAKTCQCGSACLSSFIQITVTMNLHHVAHTVVLVDNMGGTEAPIICYFCSLDCYSQFLDRYLQRNGWPLLGAKALPEALSSDWGAWNCCLPVTHTCCLPQGVRCGQQTSLLQGGGTVSLILQPFLHH